MNYQKLSIICLTASFFLFNLVQGITLDYYIIIEENGNTLVVLNIFGSGLVNIPIKEDVNEVKVKGALYSINEDSVDISIGSTEQAAVLYKTSLLTAKDQGLWTFNMDLTDYEKNQTIVAMPNDTNIESTSPKAFIESSSFKKLIWTGNISEVSVDYSFENQLTDAFDDIEPKEKSNKFSYIPLILIIFSVISTILIILQKQKTKSMKIQNRNNILKTLTGNEKKVVEILLKNSSGMKRNKLEKESGLAKSSLAATLKNLERKRIVRIDRAYKTHYVRLTGWFDNV
jgi:uncharacterized membrane protein